MKLYKDWFCRWRSECKQWYDKGLLQDCEIMAPPISIHIITYVHFSSNMGRDTYVRSYVHTVLHTTVPVYVYVHHQLKCRYYAINPTIQRPKCTFNQSDLASAPKEMHNVFT